MNLFKCVTRCFVNGRIYDKGETLRVKADKLPHFKRVDEKKAAKPALKNDEKKKPKTVKPDILE